MTGKKRVLGSDLKKVDRHVIQPHEYGEVPELTDEMFERGDLYQGGKLISRGRPKSDDPKQQITLRLDAAVLRWFQQSGPGYQSRIGAALKSHMTRQQAAARTPPAAIRTTLMAVGLTASSRRPSPDGVVTCFARWFSTRSNAPEAMATTINSTPARRTACA